MRTQYFRGNRHVAVALATMTLAIGASPGRAEDSSKALSLTWDDVSLQEKAMSDTQLPDSAVVMRWAALFAHVLEEFRADRRDVVTNIEGDFSTLELRVRASQSARWVTKKLTERELVTSDLPELAKRLYAQAKAAGSR